MNPRPLRLLVCPDSFKGSLSAVEAADTMARGARRAFPNARVTVLPLADGGEGSIEALALGGGRIVSCWVTGPLGRPVRAAFLELPGRFAVIEMAQAAGLLQVPLRSRNPMRTTTRGVGQLIAAAIRRGARLIAVLTGGSATNDGGAGMAQALGVRLMDGRGRDIPPGGAGLLRLNRICVEPLRKFLRGITVMGATDVTNPLLGPRGAARMFSPQKGATPAQVKLLERGLANYARIVRRDLEMDVRTIPGAGSAGGTGAGLVAFLRARLVPGAELIFRLTGFERRLTKANLVLTGEGSLDRQTAMGKLVAQVARRAHTRHVPVIAFAGRLTLSPREIRRLGLISAHAIADGKTSVRESMGNAAKLLENKVTEVISGLRF